MVEIVAQIELVQTFGRSPAKYACQYMNIVWAILSARDQGEIWLLPSAPGII